MNDMYIIIAAISDEASYRAAKLHDVIKSKFSKWWHYLKNTWIVVAPDTDVNAIADLCRTQLVGKYGSIDFAVFELSPDARMQGWLSGQGWDWLANEQALLQKEHENTLTLLDLCKYGTFRNEINDFRNVTDIDRFLDQYSGQYTEADIANTRDMMINLFRKHKKMAYENIL